MMIIDWRLDEFATIKECMLVKMEKGILNGGNVVNCTFNTKGGLYVCIVIAKRIILCLSFLLLLLYIYPSILLDYKLF